VTGIRSWVVGVIGAAIIATAVLGATQRQRSTSDTNFNEAQAAWQMQLAMLNQERGLDQFLAAGGSRGLQLVYEGKLQLAQSLVDARRLSSDDSLELRAVAEQARAFHAWTSLASAAIAQRQRTGSDDTPALERQRSTVIERFLAANNTYGARLAVNRFHEERSAALLPVWLLLGLGGLLAAIALVLSQRRRTSARRILAFTASQARFAEAIQFAESEAEARELLSDHLTSTVPGSNVLVLNRNNSADRLEPSRDLADGDPLREKLLDSQPRSCLAVRLSRRYTRDVEQASEPFSCKICGALTRSSSCQPLLVGGEVIGSVLVEHEHALSRGADARLSESVAQAAPVLANLRNLAIAEVRAATDALTGLPNRRTVDDTLRRMLAQAHRTSTPFSVALLDLDHFKQINDTYGHESGDNVLAALAALLHAELRVSDFAGRSGGEEFVVFLPNTSRSDAVAVADKIRVGFHALRIATVDRTITTSIGVASYPDDASTPEALMRIADRALYSAKQLGRDRVEMASTTDRPRLAAL
jgi:diguanylate cyclase (GGDEF)-like protein